MGKTPAELMKLGEQGKLLSNEIIPLLMKGLNERFGGSMEEMSNTFGYMIANMKETARMGLAGVTKPLFDEIKEDLQGVQALLKDDEVSAWGDRFSDALLNIYNGAKSAASAVLSIANFVADHWKVIGPIIYGVTAGLVAYKTALIGAHVWGMATAAAMKIMTVAQLGLNGAMRANPIGMIVTLLGILVTAGVYVVQNWEQVKLAGMNTWNVVVSAAESAVNRHIEHANVMLKVYRFAFDSIAFAGTSIWNTIVSASEKGIQGLLTPLNAVRKAMGDEEIKVNFSGAKLAATRPSWGSYDNLIPTVDFSGAKFSEDSIMAQTRRVQEERDKKKSKAEEELAKALASNTEAITQNTTATSVNTSATNKNTLKGNQSATDIADTLLGRIERHLYGT